MSYRAVACLALLAACSGDGPISPAPGATPPAQRAALADLERATGSAWRAIYAAPSPGTAGPASPRVLLGRTAATGPLTGPDAVARARAFLADHGAIFGIADSDRQLGVLRWDADARGAATVTLRQRANNVPVRGGGLRVHFAADGSITAVSGRVVPDLDVDTAPQHEAGAAAARARALVAETLAGRAPGEARASLQIVVNEEQALLAHRVEVAVPDDLRHFEVLLADDDLRVLSIHDGLYAHAGSGLDTGGVRRHFDITPATDGYAMRSTAVNPRGSFVFTMSHSEHGSPQLVTSSDPDRWDEGVAGAGSAVDAFVHQNLVHRYWRDVHDRHGVDGAGAPAISVVHFGSGYGNAFWARELGAMVYGDGDGQYLGPLAAGLDVVAHELAHGFTQHTSDLVYQDQSGALNEASSDVLAVFIEHWAAREAGAPTGADWRIGEDVVAPGSPLGDALRDLAAPARFGDPDHMQHYLQTTDDYGGVHTNSSIVGHAVYLLAHGGTNATSGVTVDGIGIVAAERIWVHAATTCFTDGTDFAGAAGCAIASARALHGDDSCEARTVENAFVAVGILAGDVTPCDACVPSCDGVACGDGDGCGGTCELGGGCVPGCSASCDGLACGATNPCGAPCQPGSGCTPACDPQCEGKLCGDDDGCGNPCNLGFDCCLRTCEGAVCGAPDGCGGTCEAADDCCEPSCDGETCGASDGCGGTCAPGSGCCEPACDEALCGMPDGCGGTCEAGSGCCEPICAGKTCGEHDGCGASCAPGSGCCEPSCDGATCGVPDGCGGTCGIGSGCTGCTGCGDLLCGDDNGCGETCEEGSGCSYLGGVEAEPNDSQAQANRAVIPETIAGHYSAYSRKDFYTAAFALDTRYRVTLERGDCPLYLRHWVGDATTGFEGDVLILRPRDERPHHVEVYAKQWLTQSCPYELTFACDPYCVGKSCGAPDGCGGTCEPEDGCCDPVCEGKTCGSSDGCGGICQIDEGCCEQSCDGALCGTADGCGGTCEQGSGCVCTPQCEGALCGAADGCGGTCTDGSGCCTPSCAGKSCGEGDGCGGVCEQGSGCCLAQCENKLCGESNGCGGVCAPGSGCVAHLSEEVEPNGILQHAQVAPNAGGHVRGRVGVEQGVPADWLDWYLVDTTDVSTLRVEVATASWSSSCRVNVYAPGKSYPPLVSKEGTGRVVAEVPATGVHGVSVLGPYGFCDYVISWNASCAPSCGGTTCGASDGCGGICRPGSGCVPPTFVMSEPGQDCTAACAGIGDTCAGTGSVGVDCGAHTDEPSCMLSDAALVHDQSSAPFDPYGGPFCTTSWFDDEDPCTSNANSYNAFCCMCQ